MVGDDDEALVVVSTVMVLIKMLIYRFTISFLIMYNDYLHPRKFQGNIMKNTGNVSPTGTSNSFFSVTIFHRFLLLPS